MKQRNLPNPLSRDEPGPFNFWTFVMLTLPEMQLDIVNETNFSYLRAPACHKQGMMAGFSRHFPEFGKVWCKLASATQRSHKDPSVHLLSSLSFTTVCRYYKSTSLQDLTLVDMISVELVCFFAAITHSNDDVTVG